MRDLWLLGPHGRHEGGHTPLEDDAQSIQSTFASKGADAFFCLRSCFAAQSTPLVGVSRVLGHDQLSLLKG